MGLLSSSYAMGIIKQFRCKHCNSLLAADLPENTRLLCGACLKSMCLVPKDPHTGMPLSPPMAVANPRSATSGTRLVNWFLSLITRGPRPSTDDPAYREWINLPVAAVVPEPTQGGLPPSNDEDPAERLRRETILKARPVQFASQRTFWAFHDLLYPGGSAQSVEWRQLREEVIRRDGYRCKCGSTTQLQVDHIKSLSSGGTNGKSNLQTLCHTCHVSKTGRHFSYGWSQKSSP